MLSRYFKFKTKTEDFKTNVQNTIQELIGKRVLAIGDSDGFVNLNKKYNITEKLKIIGFVPFCSDKNKTGIVTVLEENINYTEYDVILITGENSEEISNALRYDLCLENAKIKSLFIENIKDERINIEYLLKYNFDKYLPKLVKKLKNKKVMFYGAGVFLELIQHYFDISGLNVIGITDRKYKDVEEEQEAYGYKVYKPEQIPTVKPDYIVITAKRFIPIWESLYFGFLEKTTIKIIPILKKNIFALFCEMADS